MVLGKVIHYSFDAILISACLAGIKRSTGLGLAVSETPKDARSILVQYLEIGEYTFDFMVVILGRSKWFERKR